MADPHAPGQQRPTVLAAPNGPPLIHIQTPSPAGVSRNTYQQFDITPQGAILNNARTPAQTHLAGTVQGNPWLAAGTAKIILNEVNSSIPTQLHGSMEVAGARAQLIIANPSGITCNGCGVINAHQLTLTTGTPVFNTRGALEHYRVQGGAIQIDGLGLDSHSADYTALIARTVQLNAGLWAHTLQTTTGPATVALDGHPTASLPATPGDRPTVALDVSALGGMYAGKITLIGTEHGLGVRNAGQLSATSAPLTVTVDGLLENTGRLQSATATLTNRGLIDAFTTHLSAATIDNLGTGRLYGDHIALQAQTLTNRDETSDGHTHTATIAARQRLDIGADTLRNTANAMILSDGDAAIGATLDNALHATGIAALLDNRSATIDITGTLNITTTTLNNIRENVHIAHAPDVVTEARLEQPHWRKNKPNGGSGDFRLSSNYDAHEIYYLNPADILKDEPYITPDGQQIRRAIVRLTPQTSAYFYARGGLYASQAERRRMDLTARTGDSVLLYYTDRQDKQPNPDHSAAAATNDSAFIGLDTPQQNERLQTVPITYAPGDDRLTYDPTYGTCTDDCVRLVTWHDYTDPDRTLIDMHRGPNDVRDNERYRRATKTTQQEILNPDAGAATLIQSGGTMMIQTATLRNHYADLLAGGDQTIVGLPPP
ncbi:filamentous hemagglutinin N-terminal domain-containing protein, partial [Xylella fastidiosa]|uniref:filamentous hemagglutinin N-terminal domain-containing protein n=1 Tax=Xylella fastidiosa TaxID=2371 RepID=UPI003CE5AB06